MKLLYAIQGTGNGHISRAIELAPYLMKEAEVDFLISGKANELNFPYPIKFKYHGLYFIFGNRGGVNYWKSIKAFRPLRFVNDVYKLSVKNYDAVINDFEPVSAWAAKIKKAKLIAVSHQASFKSERVPRPAHRNRPFELAMKCFAPFKYAASTHYKKYDENIFLPLIRKELTVAKPHQGDKVLVYLPAFADDILIDHFSRLPDVRWQIFSKKTDKPYTIDNVEVFPVNRSQYSKAIIDAKAVVMGSGFQGTSEALYLGKKILSIPMWDQYEQICNAAALREFGVRIVESITDDFSEVLRSWIENDQASEYRFKPEPQNIAKRILELAKP